MRKAITYKASGVDIDKGNAFVRQIAKTMRSTMDKNVLKRKGVFGGLFSLDTRGYRNPILVSSSDGVGTKLLIAQSCNRHDTVGIDLVAMNVNDILCVGAKPLFFLDYIACGKLKPKVLKDVVAGIAKGCKQSLCSLIGGETAEMPGMYKENEYDLAGFAIGVVEKAKIIDGSKIKAGDPVIGFPSSGLHSNGFSLVRKVFSIKEQRNLSRELLKPTRIYAKEVLGLIDRFSIKGLAHITGGAFYEKLTKILPRELCFQIDKNSWPLPKIFKMIRDKGRIRDAELYKTFNMGIGLAVVVSKKDVKKVKIFLSKKKIKFYKIGEVVKNKKKIII